MIQFLKDLGEIKGPIYGVSLLMVWSAYKRRVLFCSVYATKLRVERVRESSSQGMREGKQGLWVRIYNLGVSGSACTLFLLE